MNLKEYLLGYKNRVVLVGPLLNEKRNFIDPVVYVDGGANFKLERTGINVGDGDSSLVKMDIELDRSKNYSDLSFVLSQISESYTQVDMFGFIGGRKDHELMNLAEVHQFLKKRKEKTVVNLGDKIKFFSKGNQNIQINSEFSLFQFEPGKVKVTGDCQYQLEEMSLKELSSHGLSNLGFGHIRVENESPLVLFLN